MFSLCSVRDLSVLCVAFSLCYVWVGDRIADGGAANVHKSFAGPYIYIYIYLLIYYIYDIQ